MSRKQTIIRLLEYHINILNKENIDSFYGKDTKVKINNISESPYNKSLLIELTITLSDKIEEETLDEKMVNYLIEDCLVYFSNPNQIITMVKWVS